MGHASTKGLKKVVCRVLLPIIQQYNEVVVNVLQLEMKPRETFFGRARCTVLFVCTDCDLGLAHPRVKIDQSCTSAIIEVVCWGEMTFS